MLTFIGIWYYQPAQINKAHLKKQFQTQIVKEAGIGKRLDIYISEQWEISRNQAQIAIKGGEIKLNSKQAMASARLKENDHIAFMEIANNTVKLDTTDLPLEIIFENDDFIAVNKPTGMVVHPASSGHQKDTLVHALMGRLKKIKGGDPARPGIIHRLDKDTSGVLLVAKTQAAHTHLSGLFKDRKVKKCYSAVVRGHPQTRLGKIDAPIGRSTHDRKKMGISTQGKNAVTKFEVLETFKDCSLLNIEIETGRTHQIRVHMASIGHPVAGDATYGDKKFNQRMSQAYHLHRQFLHAQTLEIDGHHFEANLSEDLNNSLELLRKL